MLLGSTHAHSCIEKVSCNTFFGIFKAIKPHQASAAMCDQCSCASTAQHAAAKYQQLKASWGVAAQTPAKEQQLEPGRIKHGLQVFDAVWWMLDLATQLSSDFKHPETSVWLKKHVDISELQIVYVPNELPKKQQTNNLTLLKSPYRRFTADQNHI